MYWCNYETKRTKMVVLLTTCCRIKLSLADMFLGTGAYEGDDDSEAYWDDPYD